MTNINGQWKSEWQRRVAYFNKEVSKAEKKTAKKSFHVKLWTPFKKTKKKQETELEKLFGAMDVAYRAAEAAQGDQAAPALAAYLKTIKAAATKASNHVAKVFIDLTNSAVESDMSKAEIADKKKDIKNLSKILQDDVDTLITNAHAAYVRMKKMQEAGAKGDIAAALRASKDAQLLKVQIQSNLKKGIAWLGKVERDPKPETFNKGIEQVGRDIMAPIGRTQSVFTTPKDKKVYVVAKQVFGAYGAGKNKLSEDADIKDVQRALADLKKMITVTGKWIQAIKV